MFGQPASQAISEAPSEVPSEAPSEVPSEMPSEAASKAPGKVQSSPQSPNSGVESSDDDGQATGPITGPETDRLTEADQRIHSQFLASARQEIPFREFTLRQIQRSLYMVRVCGTANLPCFYQIVMEIAMSSVFFYFTGIEEAGQKCRELLQFKEAEQEGQRFGIGPRTHGRAQ